MPRTKSLKNSSRISKARTLISFRLPDETINKIKNYSDLHECTNADAIVKAFEQLDSPNKYAPLTVKNAIMHFKITDLQFAQFVTQNNLLIRIYSEGRKDTGLIHPLVLAEAIASGRDLVAPKLIPQTTFEHTLQNSKDVLYSSIAINDAEFDDLVKYKADSSLKWRDLPLESDDLKNLELFLNVPNLEKFYSRTNFRQLKLSNEIIWLNKLQSDLIKHLFQETKNGTGTKFNLFKEYLKENKQPISSKVNSFTHLFSGKPLAAFNAAIEKNGSKFFLKLR